MKILQINSVCGIRSTGRICTDLADILTNNGHECKIVYGRENVPEQYMKYAVRVGNDRDIWKHGISSRIFDNMGFNSKGATKRLLKWIKEYNPDIIHLHNIHGYYINIEVLFEYLASANVPVIWTLHDCWAITGHCAFFSFANCNKWREGCYKCSQRNTYPRSFIRDNSKNNWQRKKALFSSVKEMVIVTPSQWLADILKGSYLNKYSIKVVNNGIDLQVFKPTVSKFKLHNNLESKKIILGVASSWSRRKGLDDFIKLAEIINDEYVIVLVGLQDKQLKALPKKIIGITATNNAKELAEIYSVADVFVNPTYEDNYPTVNLEAQACGTPVITYRTGGSVESVPKRNVVEQGDVLGIWELIKNRKFESNCNGRKTMFDRKKTCLDYLELYEKYIERL